MEVKQAAAFCDEHVEFSTLPTKPILTLIRIKDTEVREKAIIKSSERLKGKIGAGRGNTKELTEKDIKRVCVVVKQVVDNFFRDVSEVLNPIIVL